MCETLDITCHTSPVTYQLGEKKRICESQQNILLSKAILSECNIQILRCIHSIILIHLLHVSDVLLFIFIFKSYLPII